MFVEVNVGVALLETSAGSHPFPVHPAASLFPLLSNEELKALADDIKEHGLRESVWLYRDDRGELLLDGRNRLAACALVGVEPTFRHYTGDDPIAFVVSQNIKRRHLNPTQLAYLAKDTIALYAAEATLRQRSGMSADGAAGGRGRNLPADRPEGLGTPRRERESRERAAAAVGGSGRMVSRAEFVERVEPELAAKCRAGDLALNRAERIIRDREAEARRVREAQQAPATMTIRVDLRHGDFRGVLADVRDVDAIITDPPYPAEFLPLLADLARWADRALAPDGVLAVLMGQTHLPEVYKLLGGGRPYRWTACYLTLGPGYVSHPRRVQSNWKPVLLYGGGPRLSDVVRSEGTDAAAKSLHKWGQDFQAFSTLIERLTVRGAVVADPFMGSGTTLLAAKALGRHVVGAELDASAFETARQRVQA